MRQQGLSSLPTERILERWFELVVSAYPPDTYRFLRRERDRFANPVGVNLREGLQDLLAGLAQARPAEELTAALDKIIRIRALQDFTPAQALAFIPGLKAILKEELAEEAGWEPLAAAEAWLDGLLLAAVDLYVACREQVAELRIKEMRTRTDRILEGLNRAQGERPRKGPHTDDNVPT